MESNKAISYNNVLITDPKSSMKAGLVEFDLKTKNININPESATMIKLKQNNGINKKIQNKKLKEKTNFTTVR